MKRKNDPTPAWAEAQIDVIDASDDDEQKDALLALLAALTPSHKENKYKHEIGWRAIQYLYKRTRHCNDSARDYVAPYVDDADNAEAPAPKGGDV